MGRAVLLAGLTLATTGCFSFDLHYDISYEMQIKDGWTLAPIPGAIVISREWGKTETGRAVTDKDGICRLRCVHGSPSPPASYLIGRPWLEIVITADGYEPLSMSLTPSAFVGRGTYLRRTGGILMKKVREKDSD